MDAVDSDAAAAFWKEALGYERLYERGAYTALGPPEGDTRPRLLIQRVDVVSPGKTAVHLDIRVDDPEAEVARLEGLGARVAWRVDETDRGGSSWTTMAAPQGTLFCVCPHPRGEVGPCRCRRARRYVVIGAGIHGLSTAWHLAKELEARGLGSGADVVVLDKTGVGAGPSGLACGVIRNNYFQPAMRELMAHSVEVWESDPEAFHYHPVGYLQIAPR